MARRSIKNLQNQDSSHALLLAELHQKTTAMSLSREFPFRVPCVESREERGKNAKERETRMR